ncbi:MAG: DNA polymerase I [Alphaproteobacteria bacterium]|nr:DNA polymerase I [Alphaproteobacteria bacterium]
MQKLYLVDGSGFIFRAFHALPPLKRPDGTPVGAVFGFCNMLIRLLEQINHGKIAVIFDAGRQTFRQGIYPDYKAHRPDTPPDLIPQFSIIRDACRAFAVPSIEMAGFEADDLIATYAEVAKIEGYEVVIVSSDKDLMQLVDDKVSLFDPIKSRPIKREEVFEKFGVYPDKVIDVQALAGDSSDNVPGVPSIGPKTAAELINQFGNLETLLSNLAVIKQPKRRQALMDNIENARISYKLVTLVRDVPMPLPLTELEPRPIDLDFRESFLKEQGFNALLSRFYNLTKPEAQKPSYPCLTTVSELKEWIEKAYKIGTVAIDTETTSLNIIEANLVGFSIAVEDKDGIQACYVPLAHKTDTPQIPLKEAVDILRPMLTDLGILKVGHNLKYDLAILKKYDLDITPFDDSMLLSYCLDAGKNGHGMDELALRHLNHNTIKFSDVAGAGKNQKTFDEVPVDKATDYAAEDAEITLKLYRLLKTRLQLEHLNTVYERIERPLVPVITKMETMGIKVDPNILKNLEEDFKKRLLVLEEEIYKLAGKTFNIGSPKQVGEILFDELSLPAPKKTKTGAYVTDADVLENLAAQGHSLPARMLDWRALSKLKSTYIDGLTQAIQAKTGRVHTSFSMVGAATGRLASSDPNLQNIPIRSEDGRKIRSAFVPENGYKLVSLDYSQIELRLLAHMAEVQPLIEAFQKGEDIHKITASQIFGIPLGQVDTDHRRQAKTINFGIIYGISPFGLSQQLGIPTGQAAQIIKAYFHQYPGIESYMQRYKTLARDKGYVETLWGRRCHTPGINDNNPMSRQFAERQAINAPLQGSNADIIKKAMRKIYDYLMENNSKARLILQVHDELLFEIPENNTQGTIPVLKKMMEEVVSLSVPLVVDVGIGNNWDEAH